MNERDAVHFCGELSTHMWFVSRPSLPTSIAAAAHTATIYLHKRSLTKATSEGNRAVVKRIRVVLAWLGDGNNHSLPQEERHDQAK